MEDIKLALFQNGAWFRWHSRSRGGSNSFLEIIRQLLHGDKLYAIVLLEVLNESSHVSPRFNDNLLEGKIPLMHQNHMRPPTNIRMNRNREYKLIILPVEIIEVIPPNILNISRIHKPMTIRRALDEHHRRQIINVPVRWNLHKTRLLAIDHGLHPLVSLFGVVDFGPRVARAQVVGLAIFVGHAVVVFDAVVKEKLGTFFACFPPVSISVTSFCSITGKDKTYHGATLPRGGLPTNSVNILYVLSRTSRCCSIVMSLGFSWEYPCSPISCPASRTAAISLGKDSSECPGMNQVALTLYLSKNFSRRSVPTVAAQTPI